MLLRVRACGDRAALDAAARDFRPRRGFLLTAAEFCGLDALGELTTTQPVCAAFRSAEVGSLCNHIRDDASVGQSPSLRLCAHAGRKALRMTKLDRLIH